MMLSHDPRPESSIAAVRATAAAQPSSALNDPLSSGARRSGISNLATVDLPRPSELDDALHRAVLASLGEPTQTPIAQVSFEFRDGARAWMIEVEPANRNAASVAVFAETDHELNLTVGRTWFEVWALEDPVEWLRDLMDAVVAGKVTEVGGASDSSLSRVRIDSRRGTLGGGDLFVTPWPWRRTRNYAAY